MMKQLNARTAEIMEDKLVKILLVLVFLAVIIVIIYAVMKSSSKNLSSIFDFF